MAYKCRKKLKSDIGRRYGLSLKLYETLLQGCKNRCMICERHEDEVGTLNLDHCHDKTRNRGIICKYCNWGIANFQDNPELLRKAALYLEDH